MYEGFERFDIDTGPAVIHGVHRRGDGSVPPVLLLHGFPQTHAMWHRAAPALAADGRAVVAADLRGYGDSSHPGSGPDHAGYSFRAMAADQVEVMRRLGYDRFALVGHDRGARVSHRLALDHPAAVERLVLMDILPTAYVYSHVDRRLATAYYHWFFFIQPYDVPERLISADPVYYLHRLLGGWGSEADYPPEAMAEYERCFSDPEVRHSMMEDYRAGASIDLTLDAASAADGDMIRAPTQVIWGARGVVGRNAEDPLSVWRALVASPGEVQGVGIEGAGHFLLEEKPEETVDAIVRFLGQALPGA